MIDIYDWSVPVVEPAGEATDVSLGAALVAGLPHSFRDQLYARETSKIFAAPHLSTLSTQVDDPCVAQRSIDRGQNGRSCT
ncbi:MAG: hypothetical protein ABIP44_11805 [Pseudoxanthomonas sp.]